MPLDQQFVVPARGGAPDQRTGIQTQPCVRLEGRRARTSDDDLRVNVARTQGPAPHDRTRKTSRPRGVHGCDRFDERHGARRRQARCTRDVHMARQQGLRACARE
jgi:hypothetical protein